MIAWAGLDSTAALELMQCLHRLSSFNVAVCAVLHQPRLSVFELAHKLLLLDGSGRTVYMGPTTGALPYFSSLGCARRSCSNTGRASWWRCRTLLALPKPAAPDLHACVCGPLLPTSTRACAARCSRPPRVRVRPAAPDSMSL